MPLHLHLATLVNLQTRTAQINPIKFVAWRVELQQVLAEESADGRTGKSQGFRAIHSCADQLCKSILCLEEECLIADIHVDQFRHGKTYRAAGMLKQRILAGLILVEVLPPGAQ